MTGSRENKDYDWAFDLRAFNCESSDADSDNDDARNQGSNKKRHEARLEDFDLGSREEFACYKPNPFSIAKINAAYRSARNGTSEAKSSLPRNGHPGKACGLVQTKIDDVLKTKKSDSLKKAVATKDSRPPGFSYAHPKNAKPLRPKVGPGTAHRAFLQPQNVGNPNANPDFKESSTVCYGLSPSLESTLISEIAHTSTLVPTDIPSPLNDDPACVISLSGDEHIKPDLMSPFRDFSSFASPSRSPVSKLEARVFPKHESSPLTLFIPRHIPRPVDRPAPSNSGQVDHKSSADRQSVTTPVVPLKRSAGDPYSSAVDADESWCTLPARKKKISKNPTSSFSVTKPFRLPGLLPPRKIVKTGTEDTFGKRVTTYLPPPMHHASANEPRHSYRISRVQDEKSALALLPSPEYAACYSSLRHPRASYLSRVGQASQVDSAPTPTIREQIVEVYRPPSPPTSDPPVTSSNGADVRIQVDLRVIRDNYPRRKGTKPQGYGCDGKLAIQVKMKLKDQGPCMAASRSRS